MPLGVQAVTNKARLGVRKYEDGIIGAGDTEPQSEQVGSFSTVPVTLGTKWRKNVSRAHHFSYTRKKLRRSPSFKL